MTLVFDGETTGPGTHALIVASGDVPRHTKAGSGAAIGAARAIADWLIYKYRHPGAELASVDFLASAPDSDEISYAPPGGTGSFSLEPLRFGTFQLAMVRWRARLDSDPGNIAFFYYAGFVFRRPETLLVLQDFAAGGGAISFPSFLNVMRGCPAGRQLHIVDGIPLRVGSAVEKLSPRTFDEPAPRDPVGWGVIHGEAVAAQSGPATDFSRAFLKIVDQPSGQSWISVHDIARRLPGNLDARAAKRLSAEVTPDFDFHYPGHGTRPPSSPGLGASGDGGVFDFDDPGPDPPADEAEIDFVLDDAEAERDALGRSVLAIGLARRLHKIWRTTNHGPAPAAESRAAFVVHIDAPWGGGKTSFANFLGRVLDPCPGGGKAASFLRERYPDRDLRGIFLDDPPPDDAAAAALAELPDDARRPWIVVPFNAWQAEHCTPPWWVFYQAIRKGCFDALWGGGDGAWTPRPPGAGPRWRAWLGRVRRAVAGKLRWFYLALREYLWRLGDPRIQSVLVAAAIGLILLLGLRWIGVDFDLANSFAILTAGLAALWGLAAFFTESIAPGTGTLAERLSLGAGDPFARFRIHFSRMMTRVRRPVMVVVDDLDRCRPDFVVDLIRGIQTLLRSPRVVFVILGDRDWIERAFEAHHAAMSNVDVGPEQSFGARFVEKAIQMSFILPALGEESRLSYVRHVLLGPGAVAAPQRARLSALPPQAAAKVRESVNRAAAEPGADPFDQAKILDKVLQEVGELGGEAGPEGALAGQVERMVGESLAIRATTDEAVEREVVHELQRLAACFPANPRQIKRIVNAITIYHAVALQRPGLVPDRAFRAQLALWVIIMTEWPESWRLLASSPDLVDMLTHEHPDKAAAGPDPATPGSARPAEEALNRIRSDRDLMALIAGGGAGGHKRLETRYVRILAELTPLHSRKPRINGDSIYFLAPGPPPA